MPVTFALDVQATLAPLDGEGDGDQLRVKGFTLSLGDGYAQDLKLSGSTVPIALPAGGARVLIVYARKYTGPLTVTWNGHSETFTGLRAFVDDENGTLITSASISGIGVARALVGG